MHITRIHAFKDNYIWLLENGQGQAVVVDPGDAQPVLDYLKANHLNLLAILITHHHADHTGGIAKLAQHYPCQVYGPAKETIRGVTQRLQHHEQLTLGHNFPTFTVLDCPGHTLGHIAFYSAPYLFCGDTLFAGGCGRMFEGTPAQFSSSLHQFMQLPSDTRVYCAHEYTEANLAFAAAVEPRNTDIQTRRQHVQALRAKNQATVPSLLEVELATNPFLRTQIAEVRQAAEEHSGQHLASTELVFGALRQWKDSF